MNGRTMKQLLSMFAAAALIAFAMSPAVAQPAKTADDYYKDGGKQYNLGNFDKAIENFKQAYAIRDNPAYLYNIAQAYRQLRDCKNALFFYKRFLSLKANDTVKPLSPSLKAEIEGRIVELDECAKTADAINERPPDQNLDPDGDGDGDGKDGNDTDGTGDGTGKDVAAVDDPEVGPDGEEIDTGVTKTHTYEQPKFITARLEAGGAKVGAGDLDVPIQVTVALTAGYPLNLAPKFTLELGAGFTFTPVPYDKTGGETGNATLLSVLGNVGATYAITPKLGLHGDVGAGVLVFGGLDMGNPFTVGGLATTGGLTMFNIRIAASIEYAVTNNFLIVGTPIAFSYSPAHKDLVEGISGLTRLDFMLGLGYRM
jgi:hypothetical protein